MTYFLSFVLASILTYFLAFVLAFCLAPFLTYFLAFVLAFYPASLLTYFLGAGDMVLGPRHGPQHPELGMTRLTPDGTGIGAR